MSAMITFYLLSALTLVVCGGAIWKGGAAERTGAIVILAIVVAERIGYIVLPRAWYPPLVLGADALTAVGLLLLALRYASLWLGGCMMFYAATFVLHSFYLVTETPERGPFYTWVGDLCFAGIHICLVVGTLMSWRRRATASELELSPVAA